MADMGSSVFVFSGCFLLLTLTVTAFDGAELSALMDIKAQLDPAGSVLVSWNQEDAHPCDGTFMGVNCDVNHRVVNISLQGKRLSGTISPAFSALKSLSGLYLHYNQLNGEIPQEIYSLDRLTELYLDVNNLSGSILPDIENMASLQVLQLSHNQLSGGIPHEIGSLKKMTTLSLQHNALTGAIPASLGNLPELRRARLSFNRLTGAIPTSLANIPVLELLDVQNNSLSGLVPTALRGLKEGFYYQNNPAFYTRGSSASSSGKTGAGEEVIPIAATVSLDLNTTHGSASSRFPRAAVVAGSVTFAAALMAAGSLTVLRYRRRKQKIGSTDEDDGSHRNDLSGEHYKKCRSSLVSFEYSKRWDSFADGQNCDEFLQDLRFNLAEIESATHYFSEANLLHRTGFTSVYRGTLRDGSPVAIRSLVATSCKAEVGAFAEGLKLLASLGHENLVKMRGFCWSRARGECFLVYDYAPNGCLSDYLDLQDGSGRVLDWSTRVAFINGVAKGIGYLHSSQPGRPAMIHQNITADKVLVDGRLNPLISDAGLHRLLADDVVFSALKASAAMGYLPPEYITTGRLTEKVDVYAFGVIALQVISGSQILSASVRAAAESCNFPEFVDSRIHGDFSESEAAELAKISLACTRELPDERPAMEAVVQELGSRCGPMQLSPVSSSPDADPESGSMI